MVRLQPLQARAQDNKATRLHAETIWLVRCSDSMQGEGREKCICNQHLLHAGLLLLTGPLWLLYGRRRRCR